MLNRRDIIKITNENIKEIIMSKRLNAKTAKQLRKMAAIKAIEAGSLISHVDYVELTNQRPNDFVTGPIMVGGNSMKFFYKELKKAYKR